MDNQTIRNAFRELHQDQKLILTCSEHTYVLYHEDIMCVGSGNDIQIHKGGNSRGISTPEPAMYIDCTYVQSASIKNREDF